MILAFVSLVSQVGQKFGKVSEKKQGQITQAADTAPLSCGQYGDPDGNGTVNANDYLLINKYLVQEVTFTPDQIKRADVNGDLKVTAFDQLLVLNFVDGVDSTFPVCADRDSDGFTDAVENYIGTDPYKSCGANAWPPDFNNDGVVNVTDTLRYKGTLPRVAVSAADRRLDLDANGTLNVIDVLKLKPYMLKQCTTTSSSSMSRSSSLSLSSQPSSVPVTNLPDLTVTNFALSKTDPVPGEALKASITFKNQGPMRGPCGGFGDLDLNGYITSADAQLILKHLTGLVTFSSIQKVAADVSMDFADYPKSGGYPIVDSNDSLIILKFLDNSLKTFPACQTITPPTQPTSGPFSYIFYENLGGTAPCSLAGSKSGYVTGLKRGESTSFDLSFNAPTSPGAFSARIFADSACAINETNENNNQVTASYAVANVDPQGAHDGPSGAIDCDNTNVSGWAYDSDSPSASIEVHIYVDGGAGTGAVGFPGILANIPRADVNSKLGITGNHGFSWPIPTQYRSGSHSMYVYAINTPTGNNPLLGGSPKTYSCQLLQPAVQKEPRGWPAIGYIGELAVHYTDVADSPYKYWEAIDVINGAGSSVYSTLYGKVVKVINDSTCGRGLDISNENFTVHYCHFRDNGIKVSFGQDVVQGQIIGEMGQTGLASADQVHYAVSPPAKMKPSYVPDDVCRYCKIENLQDSDIRL